MSGSLAAALTGAVHDARGGARRALLHVLTVALGCLIGAVGLGFLTASAFLSLEAALGAAMAALVVGVGLSIIAGGILAMTRGRAPEFPPAEEARPQPAAPGSHAPDPAPLLAFTAAFVLARYLTGRMRR